MGTILAVGAHPDDIELGAGGLICRAHELGHDVYHLVLSDDQDKGERRRYEAVKAAVELGTAPYNVIFAGMQDGYLRTNGDSVARVRQAVRQHGVDADLIVTHTQSDSHNDHFEANRIAHAAFRGKLFLHYSIHLSAELDEFDPSLFIELTAPRRQSKSKAIACHRSQLERLARHNRAEYEALMGQLVGLRRAEGFEVRRQFGYENKILDELTADEQLLNTTTQFHLLGENQNAS